MLADLDYSSIFIYFKKFNIFAYENLLFFMFYVDPLICSLSFIHSFSYASADLLGTLGVRHGSSHFTL